MDPRRAMTAGAALVVLVGTGCTSGVVSETARPAGWSLPAAAAPASSSGSATTTTTKRLLPLPSLRPEPQPAPAPPPPAATAPPDGFKKGDRSPEIQRVEQALAASHYDVGPVDDLFDDDTGHGVTAFQKVHGLARTGRITQEVLDKLATSGPPPPLVPGGGATRVEVDLPRQVLFLYKGDRLAKILPVSTGTGRRYCEDGRCGVAVTPAGAYLVAYEVSGWQRSRLGRLYNPVYYDARRGIAIHGSLSVPPEPASHGCVRIPMSAAEWFPTEVNPGTPVYVLDGKKPVAPNP